MPNVVIYIRAEDARRIESTLEVGEDLKWWVREAVKAKIAEILWSPETPDDPLRAIADEYAHKTKKASAPTRPGTELFTGRTLKRRIRDEMCDHRIPAAAFCPSCDA